MGSNTAAGPANCCLAQTLLERKGLTTTTPKELGDMLGVSPVAAGYILRLLGWRRELGYRSHDRALYHNVGIVNDFSSGARRIAKLRLSRILAEEVLA